MSGVKKYLDLEGLGIYHSELVDRLKKLTYEPTRMFDDKEDLFSSSNWELDRMGNLYGARVGSIVTVGGQLWQLENPLLWSTVLKRNWK